MPNSYGRRDTKVEHKCKVLSRVLSTNQVLGSMLVIIMSWEIYRRPGRKRSNSPQMIFEV